MKQKFEVAVTKFTSSGKPTVKFDNDYQSPAWYKTYTTDLEGMAKLIGEGRAWRNGTYDRSKGRFLKEYVVSSHFIALDFDKSEFMPKIVAKFAKEIGLEPNIIHYSYSQGKKPGYNYRVIWVFDEEIEPKEWQFIHHAFMELFKEYNPDGNTKDISRFWYGCITGAQVFNEALTTMEQVNFYKPLIDTYKEIEGKAPGSIIGDYRTSNVSAIVPPTWKEELAKVCDLWALFYRGEYINRNQRFKLFSNLRYIQCKEKDVFQDILEITNWKIYDETHSFNQAQLERWFREENEATPIVEAFGEKMTVADYFNGRLF